MIKLSKRGDYALKCVCYVADKGVLVHIKDIALDQWVSDAFLRRIVADLEKAHILSTTKGRSGWVELAKPSYQISIYDVLYAVWEELWLTDCTKDIYCSKKDECYTTDALWNLQKGFNTLLKIHTIDKIIKK